MGETVKFSSKMHRQVLDDLRRHAAETNRTLASLLTEAARQLLERERVRPAFRALVEEVMDEHAELLERLSR